MTVTQEQARAFLAEHEHKLSGYAVDVLESYIYNGGLSGRAASIMLTHGVFTGDHNKHLDNGKMTGQEPQQPVNLLRA
jgi:hypothetical protein